MCSFVFAGLFCFLSGSSFILISFLSVSEQIYGYLFAIVVLGYFLGSQFSARMSKKLGSFNLIRYGSWLAFISGLIMLLLSMLGSHNVASIIGPHFFFMISVGVVMPLTMAGALAPFPHIAGSASALLGFTQMLTAAIFGATIGYVSTSTPTMMAAGIALAGFLTLISMLKMKSIL